MGPSVGRVRRHWIAPSRSPVAASCESSQRRSGSRISHVEPSPACRVSHASANRAVTASRAFVSVAAGPVSTAIACAGANGPDSAP